MNRHVRSPIDIQQLEHLQSELGSVYTLMRKTELTAVLKANSPFALGMLIGSVMSRFRSEGVSFNYIVIDVKKLTLKIGVLSNPGMNLMQVEWV